MDGEGGKFENIVRKYKIRNLGHTLDESTAMEKNQSLRCEEILADDLSVDWLAKMAEKLKILCQRTKFGISVTSWMSRRR